MADDSENSAQSFKKLLKGLKDIFSFNAPKNTDEVAKKLPANLTDEIIDLEIKKKVENESGFDRIKELVRFE